MERQRRVVHLLCMRLATPFLKSLKFDIRQSTRLYFLPVRALVAAYRQGVKRTSHDGNP